MSTVRLDEILAEVVAWSRETFPGREPLPTAVHLRREAAELCAAVARGEGAGEEVADVVILAAALADCLGIDLAGAVAVKLAILTTRRWGEPDADGVREHVRLPPLPPLPVRSEGFDGQPEVLADYLDKGATL